MHPAFLLPLVLAAWPRPVGPQTLAKLAAAAWGGAAVAAGLTFERLLRSAIAPDDSTTGGLLAAGLMIVLGVLLVRPAWYRSRHYPTDPRSLRNESFGRRITSPRGRKRLRVAHPAGLVLAAAALGGSVWLREHAPDPTAYARSLLDVSNPSASSDDAPFHVTQGAVWVKASPGRLEVADRCVLVLQAGSVEKRMDLGPTTVLSHQAFCDHVDVLVDAVHGLFYVTEHGWFGRTRAWRAPEFQESGFQETGTTIASLGDLVSVPFLWTVTGGLALGFSLLTFFMAVMTRSRAERRCRAGRAATHLGGGFVRLAADEPLVHARTAADCPVGVVTVFGAGDVPATLAHPYRSGGNLSVVAASLDEILSWAYLAEARWRIVGLLALAVGTVPVFIASLVQWLG